MSPMVVGRFFSQPAPGARADGPDGGGGGQTGGGDDHPTAGRGPDDEAGHAHLCPGQGQRGRAGAGVSGSPTWDRKVRLQHKTQCTQPNVCMHPSPVQGGRSTGGPNGVVQGEVYPIPLTAFP